MSRKKYRVVGLGGTFDHFHKGHERLILFAARLAAHLRIGITRSELVRSKPFAELCESYEARKKAVSKFCREQKLSYDIIPLRNIYGPTLKDSALEALCLTKETLPNGRRINRERAKRGLPKLPLHVCDYYPNELGRPLRSVDIRAGRFSREGKVYERILKKTLTLTSKQRQFFAAPQGIIKRAVSPRSGESVFVVGDATLEYFIRKKLPYQLGVYDKKVRRKEIHSPALDALTPEISTKNKAGAISLSLTKALKEALHTRAKHIFVEGEEDLAAVALVLLLPLGATVYYGQSKRGMVEMTITKERKDAFDRMLSLC